MADFDTRLRTTEQHRYLSYPPISRMSSTSLGEHERLVQAKLLPQYVACFAATVGSFIMGTCVGWSGPALFLINNSTSDHEFVVSNTEASLLGSLMPLGALFGGVLGGVLIGVYGRRFTLFLMSAVFALAFLLLVVAQDVAMLMVGRFLSGLASGVTSIAAPVYIGETASKNVRGMLGSCFQVMVTIGVLYIDSVGYGATWRWLSVACIAPCLIWGLALFVVPETPQYLLSKKKFDDARAALQFLRGHPYIDTELSEIQAAVESAAAAQASFRHLLLPHNLKPLLISMTLMLGQQLSGINAVIFYSVSIFEEAGTSLNSFLEAIIVAGVMVAATVVAALFIDRLGRRFLLIFSSIVMAIAAFALGAFFWIKTHNPEQAEALEFLPLVSLCVFVLSFSVGFGPIPWLMMGELFGPEVKSRASSISGCFNWFLAFCVTQFYSNLADAVGTAATYWGFATILIFIFVFCILFVPETKGRSLEEIQALFRSGELLDDADPLVNEDIAYN